MLEPLRLCWPPMANHAVTPDSLTRQVFIYVVMGSVAFLVGCLVMINFVPAG